MYKLKMYDKLVLVLFWEEISIEDVETFARDIDELSKKEDEIYLIALPIKVNKYPQNVSSLLKASRQLQNTGNVLTRFYTVELSSIMTFMTNIVTQLIGIKGKIVMKSTVEELLRVIEKEVHSIPALQSSIQHLSEIKAEVDALQAQA